MSDVTTDPTVDAPVVDGAETPVVEGDEETVTPEVKEDGDDEETDAPAAGAEMPAEDGEKPADA